MGNLLSICEEKFTFTRRREEEGNDEEENDIADDGFAAHFTFKRKIV